jgi:peptidoglycan hydrolase CwlO-like protein
MKKINPKRLFFAILFSLLLIAGFFKIGPHFVAATDTTQLLEEMEEYRAKLVILKSQANTLSNQIAQFDAQIRLTTLKIQETQEKILLLGGRINQLEISLEALTEAFATRATETYKMTRLGDSLIMLITASDLGEVVSRYHYLQRIQEADRDLLVRLQEAQDVYEEEKVDQEDLHAQLEQQGQVLGAQKTAKADLLAITRNDEKKYQQLLAQARAEYEAIQAIIAGKGIEEEVGKVNQGQRIASIIQGGSCNSSGTHLHFTITQNGSPNNPFDYLKEGIDYENCSGPGDCSPEDPFNPHGNWDWPINPKIRLTQGYGYTWAVANTWVGRIYSFHNGIDINSLSSSEVRAVTSGTLYRGSYSVGCPLKYVRVDHDDSDKDTLYLHVNY